MVLRTKLDFNPSDIHIKYRFQNRALTEVIHNIWKPETKGGKFTWKFRKPPDEVFPRYRVCEEVDASGFPVVSQCCTDDASLFGCQDGEPCASITCPPEVSPDSEDDEEPMPVCGNDIREAGEECDGTDDEACPGLCQSDCTCPEIPTVSEWGLIGMGVLTLVAGAVVFARRRAIMAGGPAGGV